MQWHERGICVYLYAHSSSHDGSRVPPLLFDMEYPDCQIKGIHCDGFVNGPFRYAVLNNMRNYIEFEDKEDMAKAIENKLRNAEQKQPENN